MDQHKSLVAISGKETVTMAPLWPIMQGRLISNKNSFLETNFCYHMTKLTKQRLKATNLASMFKKMLLWRKNTHKTPRQRCRHKVVFYTFFVVFRLLPKRPKKGFIFSVLKIRTMQKSTPT